MVRLILPLYLEILQTQRYFIIFGYLRPVTRFCQAFSEERLILKPNKIYNNR
jgi:hypothetical protein